MDECQWPLEATGTGQPASCGALSWGSKRPGLAGPLREQQVCRTQGAGWRPRGWAARGSVAQSQHRGPWPASVLPRACRPGTRTPASSPHMPPPQARAHTTTPHSSYHLFSRKAPGVGAAQHHKVTEAARHLGLPLPGAGGAPHRPLSIKGKASLPRPPAFAWSGLVRPQTGAPARGRGLPPATWLLCPEGPLQPRSPERLLTGTPQVGLT